MDNKTNFSLAGKVALVTDAPYGIGFVIAKAMTGAGATIVFNGIEQELVGRGLTAYGEVGIKTHGHVYDVTDKGVVNAMVTETEVKVGVIDTLVSNAGIIRRIPMTKIAAKDFRRVTNVDLNAPFIVSKAVIPSMMKKGHGKIISVCSMMPELGRETAPAYAAVKGGLKMLTRNITSEYSEYNIQCSGIGSGYATTPQTAPLYETQPDDSGHPFDQFIISKTPTRRWGETEGLGGLTVFPTPDASNFVNGQILYVDGDIQAYTGKQPS